MVALHTEWFPVSYDEAFYTKSVKGEIFTIAATYPAQAACSSSAPGAADDGGEEGEHLLGIITMSTTCDLHSEDARGEAAAPMRAARMARFGACVAGTPNLVLAKPTACAHRPAVRCYPCRDGLWPRITPESD